MSNSNKYERLLRKLRHHPLYDGSGRRDDQIYRMIGKAQALLKREREREARKPAVGPYSGLTRQELRASGTCETDWY